MTAINSSFAATMLNSLPAVEKKDMRVLMKDVRARPAEKSNRHRGVGPGARLSPLARALAQAPPEAVDMVVKLLDFNPERRLDIDASLKQTSTRAECF